MGNEWRGMMGQESLGRRQGGGGELALKLCVCVRDRYEGDK